jgi:cyclopropane fatty-acyl-phospholipid synthase-like methyltransferase
MAKVRVLDIGSGPGIYVDALNRHACMAADGVDIEATPSPHNTRMSVFDPNFAERFAGKYDLVMSFEVGEHLPDQLANAFVERLTQCLDPASEVKAIYFSAAHVGQGGSGHINCQPKQYWIDLFSFHGFQVDEIATQKFIDYLRQGYHMGWLAMNGMVFKPQLQSFADLNFHSIVLEEAPQAHRVAEYFAQTFGPH